MRQESLRRARTLDSKNVKRSRFPLISGREVKDEGQEIKSAKLTKHPASAACLDISGRSQFLCSHESWLGDITVHSGVAQLREFFVADRRLYFTTDIPMASEIPSIHDQRPGDPRTCGYSDAGKYCNEKFSHDLTIAFPIAACQCGG